MLRKNINIFINQKKYLVKSGQTILQAIKQAGLEIPSLCFHPDLKIQASCRICVVEIAGCEGLHTACSAKVCPGMKIKTHSRKIYKARKMNLELLFSQHERECHDCVYLGKCQLLKLAREYQVELTRFKDRKKNFPVHQFGPSLIFDSSKCIDCGNCVEVCSRQANFLQNQQKQNMSCVAPSGDRSSDCIYCGQCIVHCPAGSFEAVGEFEDVEKPLQNKNKVVVFQFAPAVRSSVGEEFAIPHGSIVTEKLVAALKQLGANYVFDTSVGADFTTYEESQEWLGKIRQGCTPCFTSCCSAWVKYVEFYEPALIPHLATTRSPQIILGGLIKTYFAKKKKIDPKDIYVVSIMPCVAKKYEIERPENKIGELKPVDLVMTTREVAWLLKKHRIDLKNITEMPLDDPLGHASGAGVIYGASGGVVESALRSSYFFATGKAPAEVDLKAVRGIKGIKTAKFKIGKKQIRIAAVNGISNAKKIIAELKKNPKAYQGVEVMACLGGCIGGGGQPLPVNDEIRAKRSRALYNVDNKKQVRLAHESPIVQKVYQEFLKNDDIRHKVCHTSYNQKNKEVLT